MLCRKNTVPVNGGSVGQLPQQIAHSPRQRDALITRDEHRIVDALLARNALERVGLVDADGDDCKTLGRMPLLQGDRKSVV